jgi:F-type H+-transporting ATPase subunit a
MIMPAFGLDVTPLAAQKLFSIGPFDFTNAMLFGLITAVTLVTFLTIAASWSELHPRSRLAFYIEVIVEFLLGTIQDAFGDRKRAIKFLPLLLTLFFFILAANISGLLPGVETIKADVGGHDVSLLRSFTTDLNATAAMAILTIGTVQFFALKELGLKGHLKHYFSDRPWNPMNFFIGLNEVFGELLRIVTLSMRLFGVIYAGEVLLHAIAQLAGNFAWAATLPVMFLEIFFSLIQAYLFMMLSTVYLAMATAHSEDEPDEHEATMPAPRELKV